MLFSRIDKVGKLGKRGDADHDSDYLRSHVLLNIPRLVTKKKRPIS